MKNHNQIHISQTKVDNSNLKQHFLVFPINTEPSVSSHFVCDISFFFRWGGSVGVTSTILFTSCFEAATARSNASISPFDINLVQANSQSTFIQSSREGAQRPAVNTKFWMETLEGFQGSCLISKERCYGYMEEQQLLGGDHNCFVS